MNELAKLTPAEIECDFSYIETALDDQLEDWRDADLSKIETSSIKGKRAEINKAIKSVEDARKTVKREYNAPLAEFEAKVKELLAPAREVEAALGDEVRRREDERREGLRQGLERTYEDFAPALAEVVPFETICEPQWLTLSYGAAKAAEELEAKAAKAATDWQTLREMDSVKQYDVAEREFFRTLNLGEALRAAEAASEEQSRIESLKGEVEDNRGGERRTYVFTVALTEAELRDLKGWFGQRGIHGTVREAD